MEFMEGLLFRARWNKVMPLPKGYCIGQKHKENLFSGNE